MLKACKGCLIYCDAFFFIVTYRANGSALEGRVLAVHACGELESLPRMTHLYV